MNVQFRCDVADQQKEAVVARLEQVYGRVRCDVHGEQLRFVVSKVYCNGVFSYGCDACCDEFHLTICLEHDREFELQWWNEWYQNPDDGSCERG